MTGHPSESPDSGHHFECDCISRINADLAAKGRDVRIDCAIAMIGAPKVRMAARCQIVTERPSKKRKAPETIIATYCPFCGNRYPDGKEAAA